MFKAITNRVTSLVSFTQVRQKKMITSVKHKNIVYKRGGLMFEGIRYYPRDPKNFEDPPIEPAKLFRIERIKPVKGNPFWERKILRGFNLLEPGRWVSIVKNVPSVNQRLWKIKHLINVIPITFPYGEPTAEDIKHTFLKENGECIVMKEIKVDEAREKGTKAFIHSPVRLDRETIKKDLRKKWVDGWDWRP